MPVSVTGVPAGASESAILTEKLAQKELDYNELQSLFTKYKLKQKVKYEKLREEVTSYIKKNGANVEKENNALTMIRLSEAESKLEEAERRADSLSRELQRRQAQINDHVILIRNMEEQLRARLPLSEAERSERKRMAELVDMDSVHAQMMYKDERIVELNNMILDKERQILDLQEMVREQGEVASSKSKAMKLVQKRFEEIDSVSRHSVGTETDVVLTGGSPADRGRGTSSMRTVRGSSPGRAIKGTSPGPGHGKHSHGNASPPPLDPSEGFYDDDEPGSSSFRRKKRVTFDLPPSGAGSVESVAAANAAAQQQPASTSASQQRSASNDAEAVLSTSSQHDDADEIAHAIEELTSENEHLRTLMAEQQTEIRELRERLVSTEEDVARGVRESKSAVAKARVVAQARIKDLEDKMSTLNRDMTLQAEQLQTENETLRSTREWEVEENARLREQVAQVREKNKKLAAELDSSVVSNREMEERMLAEQKVMQHMMEDLEDAEGILVQQGEEKEQLFDDIERLKGAIFAQEQFIEVLEADIVIYEEHIGILRESLGASKVDHRDLIRSKAFEAKLKALEEEKQEIARTRHDERLRTKALNAKVRMLEAENEKLVAKVCDMEMKKDGDGEEQTLGDAQQHSETLELQLHEADRRMASMRTDFEQQLTAARQDAERSMRQAELLRDSVDRLQSDLDTVTARSSSERASASSSKEHHGVEYGQTCLPAELDQAQLEEIETLRQKIEDVLQALHDVDQIKNDLGEQITQMGAENFELTQRVEEVTRENQELRQRFDEEMRTELERVQRERDVCHQQAAELDSALEELKLKLHDKDEELRTVQNELETTRSQVTELSSELVSSRSVTSSEYVSESVSVQHSSCENTSNSDASLRSSLEALEEENKRLRSELDLARLSLQETREVQREVSELKAALEEERRQGEVKWQEVCEKLMQSSAGQPDEPGRMSRKTSVDEMHIYLDTYADKCKRLEDELREARTKLQMGGNPGHHHTDSHVPAERVGALEQALHETKERIQELERELDDRVHESEAIEHKLARMEEELEVAKQKTEQDKTEKKKLKAAVKQLRDKLHQEKQTQEESGSSKKGEEVRVAPPPVEESVGKVEIQTVQTSAPTVEQASGTAEELQRLRIQLNAADMEARLTGDLNAELEKCIAELEEKVSDVEKEKEEAVRKCAQLEESKEELSREVDILTNMQEEMSFRVEQAEESFNVDELHNKIACLEREVDSLKTDLVLSREQCEETKKNYDQFIQNAEAVRLHMQQNEQVYCDEIRSLSIANEDLRRQLSDVEAETHRLEEKENDEIVYLRNCLTEARAHLRVMQATADESLLSARTHAQEETPVMAGSPRPGATSQERESLQRASSATSEAVATVIRENKLSRENSPAALGSRSEWSTAESMSDHSIAAPPVESEHEYSSRVLPQTYEQEQEHVHCYGDLVANHHPHQAERAASNYATPSTSDERFEDASATAFTYASGYSMPTVSADDLVVGAEEECVTTDEIVADTTQQSSNMEQHTTMLQAGEDLFLENQLLRECVNQTTRMQDDLGDDVEKLSELRMELENAVDALKGEVWSLNGQLKASVLDRENLADRLAVVDSQLIAEKRKTTQLDQELSEQVEMTEKAQRQAAESENESNRRLAECLDMESRREEIEKAYAQLMDYYTQLHASYEALYKSVNSEKVENGTETDLTSSEVDRGATALRLHATYQEQLSVTREQVRMLRDQLKSLAEDILKCDLASLESSLTANLYSIQHALSRVTELITNSAPMEEADLAVVVDTIIRECGLEDVDGSSPNAKLEAICDILKKKMHEVEESRKAIGEQRRVCRALEERLCLMEHEHVGDTTADLARQLASTQSSLREKTFECEELQRRVDELKEAVEDLTNSQETQEAAKLATRQADVDALFRANAELAHTNVQLQNEVDELNEERAGQREGVVGVTPEEEQRRREKQRWNEAEIARLHEVERLLNENIEELNQDVEKAGEQIKKLEQELAATKQKLEDAVAEAEWYREGESEKVASGNEVPKEAIEDLQKQKAENEAEIDRLRDVESLLNRTIKSIEDKLAAAEERVLELEDTLVAEREKVNETAVLAHAPVVTVASTVASASVAAAPSTSDGWGWGDEEETETEETPQLAEDGWGLDGGEKKTEPADDKNKEWEMELLDARNRAEEAETELTVLRSVSQSLNEQISLLRGERDEYLEKVDVLEGKVDEEEQKIKELEEALEADKEKIRELERALEETAGQPANEEEKAEQGGWDDWSDEPSAVESQEKVDERVEVEHLKIVEEGLRDELEERNAKINDLTAEFTARLAEKERIESELRDLIAELEQRAEQGGEKSAAADGGEGWSEDWTTDSQTDVSELRNKLELAEDRIATLTLDLEEKSRDLLRLQEQNERQRTASRSSISAAPFEEQPVAAPPQREAANDGWGEAWADDESAPDEENTELESERQGREDAERERDELRETVANLGRQVEELTVRLENYEAQEEEVDEMREELSTLREQLQRARVESEELRQKVEQSETQTKPASSDWGWGEDNDNDVATETESEEVSTLRQRAADVEEQLRSALERCDRLEANLVQSSEEQEQTVKDAEELQTSLQSEIDELLQRVRQVEVALDEERGLRARAEEESANGQQREVALDSEIAELKQRLSEAQKELEESKLNNKEASESDELNAKIKHLEEQLEQTIKQNGLLKDSEACLIDSVDQYSELAEKYKEEKERLQDVVNQLEAKLVELDSLRSRVYQLESEAESMHVASSADERTALQQRITRLEGEVSDANSAKEVLARTLAETQERLQAVQKDRDHIKRLYDELRAKIAARRRAAAAGTPSGLSTGSQGGGLSRRSSIASTVDHEIPEEPIVDRGQSNSPAAVQVVHGFGSSFASASSSSQENQLLESYRQLVSDVLTRVEEYLERADTNGRLESLELERVCSRLLSAEERILKQVEELSDEENCTEMARKKKVKVLSSPVEVEKSAAVELSSEAKVGVKPEPQQDIVMDELIVSMAAGDNGEIVIPVESVEHGNEANEGNHIKLEPGDVEKKNDVEDELSDLKKKYLVLEDEKEMLEEQLAAAEKKIAEGNALETEAIAAEWRAEEMAKELDSLRAHCRSVEAKLEEINKDKKVDDYESEEEDNLEDELNALREKVEQLTKENEQVIKERDSHLHTSQDAMYSLEELREEYDDLVRAKNNYLEMNDELCRDKMELLMRVRLEVHKRDVLKEENKMLLDRVKQLEEVCGVLEALEARCDSSDRQYFEEVDRCTALADENKILIEKVKNFEEVRSALEALEARCDSSDEQLQDVLVAAERSEQRANESEEKLAQTEVERDKLAEELRRVEIMKKEEVLQAEETKNQMTLEKTEVLEEIETASKNLQALSEQIAASEMKLATYEEKLEQSAETETLLKEQLAEEMKNAETQREGLQESIREQTMEAERWKNVVGERETIEQQLKTSLEQKRVEIAESSERLKNAEERVEELEARIRRAEEEQGNEQQLKMELDEKRAELEEGYERLKNAEERVEELEARVRRAEEEQGERVRIMEDLAKELENRAGEVSRLEGVIETSASAQQELVSKNVSLEDRVRDLDTQVAEFELKFAEVQRENVEHEQAVQRAAEENAMLEATRVHLKASEDALEAFHKEQLESQNTIRCLQDELSRVQREYHGARETVNDMHMRLTEADSKLEHANESAAKATLNERELTEQLQELQVQYTSVHRELELCRVNEAELRAQVDHLNSQLNSTVEKAAVQEAETTVELQQMKDLLRSAWTERRAKENELCEQVTVLQAQLAGAEQMCHELKFGREETITLTNVKMQEETVSGRSASPQHKVTDEVAHLREDCVHLETQLKDTLEQMQVSEAVLETVKNRLQSREDALLKLKGQLEELTFENEQMRRSTMNADASARIAELQRELSAQRTAMDERIDVLVDELRVSEEALEEQKMQRVEIERREETSREQAEKWYAEYENVSRELESMMRSIEEVRHLETALAKSREEQEALARQLNEAQDVNQRAQHEKDALNAQLTIVSQLLEERTEKLRQAGEAKTKQTIRMLEIESRMNDWNSVDRGGAGPSTSPEVVGQQSSTQPAMVAVDLTDDHTVLDMDVVGEVGEARQSDNNLQERLRIANERIRQLESRSVGMTSLLFGGEGVETEEEGEAGTLSATGDADTMCDEFLDGSTTRLLPASSPTPALLARVRRVIRAWRAHPQRALRPFVRYGIVGYLVLSQLLLLHCWFLAACI